MNYMFKPFLGKKQKPQEAPNLYAALYDVKDAAQEYEEATKEIEQAFIDSVTSLFDIVEAGKAFGVHLPCDYKVIKNDFKTGESCIILQRVKRHAYYGGWEDVYKQDAPVIINEQITKFLNEVRKDYLQKVCLLLLERVKKRQELAERNREVYPKIAGVRLIINDIKDLMK